MKNGIILLLFAVGIGMNSCTIESDSIKLFPIKSGDKWGYIDDKGQYVINSQFDDAYNFSEGLALFKSSEGKFGFIGEDGKFVINPVYKDANSFSEGLACVVMENGKPQFIDKDNKILFTVDNAEYCFGFKEGLARVRIKGKWGFVDKTGIVVVSPIYEDARDFTDGLAAVAKMDETKKEILWGYIDKSGAVKINFQFVKDKEKYYCDPGGFNEGLAFTSSDGKQWGCIDKEGKYQINPQFEGDNGNPYKFKNGVSIVLQGGSYGYIDNGGKFIINPQFKDSRRFSSNGLAAVQHSDGKWGFINKEGKYEINPQFEYVEVGFFGSVAFVKASGKYGIIDEKGLYVLNPQFDDIKLHDIGSNYGVKSDYVDNEGIAEMIFEKSDSKKHLGYDISTNLGQIVKDYPDVDVSELEPYLLNLKNPKIELSEMVKINSLDIGFDELTYTETPIYKTVRKYNYYYGGYYNAQEFERMDKKIQNSAPVSYSTINLTLESTNKGSGKTLAEALKNQAAKKMNVSEIADLGVKNTEYKGIFILKGPDCLIFIHYNQKEEEKSKPNISITVVNRNFDGEFEELTQNLVKEFND